MKTFGRNGTSSSGHQAVAPLLRSCASTRSGAPISPYAPFLTHREKPLHLTIETRKTQPTSRAALKAKYLECLHACSAATLRATVQALVRLGAERSLLLTWAVSGGHDKKQVAKLLSEVFCALGLRQRTPGAGRRSSPPGLLLLAFARGLFGDKAVRSLHAACRAAKGPASAQLKERGLRLLPEPELYAAAVQRFSRKLARAANIRKSYETNAT